MEREPEDRQTELDDLYFEILSLQAQIDDLKEKVFELREENEL